MIEVYFLGVSAERLWLSVAIVIVWALASLYWLGWFSRARAIKADILIAHASQTGTAQDLAERMQKPLAASRASSALIGLADLSEAALASARTLILVASTTGEGEAPDGVRHLEKTLFKQSLSLPDLEVFILALGDRSYDGFCAYGHRLEDWAQGIGAKVTMVTVDNLAEDDLGRWNDVMEANGLSGLSRSNDDEVMDWTLVSCREIATGDTGPIEGSRPGSLFHLRMKPATGVTPAYRVGDLFEWHGMDQSAAKLGARVRRDFSIASVPGDDTLDLIVRRVELPDGAMGVASKALTAGNAKKPIQGRLRTFANFHQTAGNGPLLAIAAGSGWGGGRAHVISAIEAQRPVWLIFGERGPSSDLVVFADMRAWEEAGKIERLDLALSRASDEAPRYAQDCVTQNGDAIAQFLGADGAVAICGAASMGARVHEALSRALSQDWIEQARAEDRWRSATY